jgi:hypothetical protein
MPIDAENFKKLHGSLQRQLQHNSEFILVTLQIASFLLAMKGWLSGCFVASLLAMTMA